MNIETINSTTDLAALRAALTTLDHLAVDTLYKALKVYDLSLAPDDNWGHSVSIDIQDLLDLFPQDAKHRYDASVCTMLPAGVHDATIKFIDDSHEPFIVVVKVNGSGDCPEVLMSKGELDKMLLNVGIPKGTASGAVKDFSCRVVIEHCTSRGNAGYDKPWHRIKAFLPRYAPDYQSDRNRRFCQECDRFVADAGGDYFGVCPKCHKTDGCINIGSSHWSICKEHKSRWCFGANLLSGWEDQTEEDQRKICDTLGFDSFEDVEPHHCE